MSKHEMKINTNDYFTRLLPVRTILANGGKLERRINHTKMAEVALLCWCGTMAFVGAIFLAINDVGLVFAGTLIGGGLIIIAVFIDVEDLYLVWSENEKINDPTIKTINLDEECENCKIDFDPDRSMGYD